MRASFRNRAFASSMPKRLLARVEPDGLQGELALDLGVAGQVDDTHGAAAQRAQDDVPSDLFRAQTSTNSAAILPNVSRPSLAIGRDVPRPLVRLQIGRAARVLRERPLAVRELGPRLVRARRGHHDLDRGKIFALRRRLMEAPVHDARRDSPALEGIPR